jgi:fatty-acyl-CoA synthase
VVRSVIVGGSGFRLVGRASRTGDLPTVIDGISRATFGGMRGLMQDVPLTITHLFDRAERYHGHKALVTATGTGRERTTYEAWANRTRRLGDVLDTLDISPDGRVATFAWNTARHLELYFAAPCTGRVLHTLNIRLFPDQLTYIVNHADDEVIFVDRSLLALLAPLLPTFERLRHLVVMDDGAGDIPADLHGHELVDYESLLADATPVEFHVDDEHRAASMCYTSGTTGNPKGVLYSHRSTFLHTFGAMTVDSLGAREADVIMPVVPMFHANAWGLAHAAVATGASLVMPGADLSGSALADLIVEERVTVAAGVPTIWMQVLPALAGRDTSSLRAIPCGGSAVPKALSEAYREQLGKPILQAWGMTETSPIAAVCQLDVDEAALPLDEQAELRTMVGRISFGVEMRVVDPDSQAAVPWDGESSGELQCRGNWIAATYYEDERAGDSFTSDGWLRTGDVATVDERGRIRLVDRTKDLIKSGGEWISSVELENELMAHPKIAEAAVIGVPHPRWSERPLACVVVAEGAALTKDEVLAYLSGKVAKWQLPDDVVFIDEVPKTSVGKFSKKTLRDEFGAYQLPTA